MAKSKRKVRDFNEVTTPSLRSMHETLAKRIDNQRTLIRQATEEIKRLEGLMRPIADVLQARSNFGKGSR